MISAAKTIQIFLPDGNPRGVRIADITSRTVRVLAIPRSRFKEASLRQELNCVGCYYLVGESDEPAKTPSVYIGEAEDLCERVRNHLQKKHFWTTALAVSSKTASFTKVHAKYLEWLSHQAVERSGRFTLENTAVPSRPHVSEGMEADLEDSFDSIRTLVAALGFPLFEDVRSRAPRVFLCNIGKLKAKGTYADDGFVVLGGSDAAPRLSPAADGWVVSTRESLTAAGVIVKKGARCEFSRDHLFSSPSAAAMAVLGRRANGWTSWRDENGYTLDQLERGEESPLNERDRRIRVKQRQG